MKRGDFLKTSAAAVAAAIMPETAVCAEERALALSAQNRSAPLEIGSPDFELSLDFRALEKAKAQITFHNGYAVLIDNDLDSPCWWRKTGSLRGVRNIVKNFAKDGEWSGIKIRVHGAQICVWVGGVKVVEYIEPKNPYRTNGNSLLSPRATRAEICLISESGVLEYKNVKISPLARRFDLENQRAMAIDEASDSAIRLHQADFPVLDFHVHLKGGMTIDWALARSRKLGINYAIAPNCGRDFELNTAQKAQSFLDEAKNFPALICMQGEGREWHKLFPAEIREQFDFVFTDAMTFDDPRGSRTHIWRDSEVKIPKGGEMEYFEHMKKVVCQVIAEPADIYANPLWLPRALAPDFGKYWTRQNKQIVVDALLQHQKPMEINTTLKNIPDMELIEMAHAQGVKFSFGTNNINPEFSPFGDPEIKSHYGKFDKVLKIVETLGLAPSDIYKPRMRRA
ncbi:MAG: DUF1080 domain-containing protein [Opitutales bacterium]|nr:DUF1080 domain-containing protein [Opitutales bacterium]